MLLLDKSAKSYSNVFMERSDPIANHRDPYYPGLSALASISIREVMEICTASFI